jgi:hypothetical protein
MYCSSCGAKVSVESLFCGSCGAKRTDLQESVIEGNPIAHNIAVSAPSINLVQEQASYGPLAVKDGSVHLKGKVYISAMRRTAINQSFQSTEVNVNTGQMRGVLPNMRTIISFSILFFVVLFLSRMANTSSYDGSGGMSVSFTSPLLLLLVIISIIGIVTRLIRKTDGIRIRSGNASYFVPLYHYHKPNQLQLLLALISNGVPVDGLQSVDRLSHSITSSVNETRKRRISRTSFICGIIVLGYAVGYVLPWFEDITGVDVVRGLGKASSFASELGFGDSLVSLYYFTIATLIISIIAGICALGMRSKGSIVMVFLASLLDLYFLIAIVNRISDVAEYIPNLSSNFRYIEAGPGIVLIIIAVILSTIISFIALFTPNPSRNLG